MGALFTKRGTPADSSLLGEAAALRWLSEATTTGGMPVADGWRARVCLHQLAPLLHHCALFGRAYAAEALEAARTYA